MDWFSNMRTRTKLSLSFALIIIILMAIMLTSYSTIKYLDKTNKTFFQHDLVLLENLMLLRDNQSDSEAAILMMSITTDKNELDKLSALLKLQINEQEVIGREILNFEKDSPEVTKKYDNIKNAKNDIDRTIHEKLFPLISQGKMNEARNLTTEDIYPKFDTLGNATIALVNDVRTHVNESLLLSSKEVSNANRLYIIMGGIAILIVIILTFILNHAIARPLKEISLSAKLISLGDLSVTRLSSVGRKDEVGILADTFQTMRTNLRHLTKELSTVINLLESSVNEIATATAQLVASASETATAISETTTTIDEVKQTSLMASQKAKTISESSQKSTEVSNYGKKAADEINQMTNHMQGQMDLIAESMVRLSEQSQSIGSIITAVEDMAQQSNLLSVNASIEAAKAGEQGRGFAIVAQEVKSLANQSKEATGQVRAVLSDIQKATSAAVMATEQGSKSVEAGVKKSEETGQSILSLVNTVNESSRDASQIAATTNQQLVGMEQAAVAMENIKQATFQNVEGSKQLEIATNNIKALGKKLKELISQYELKNDAEGA
jgi:methyl-accepting chemotaxis protein